MTLKIGIIGCGLMGGIHTQCFSGEKNCQVVAYTNRTAKKAEDLAKKWGGTAYSSLEELLASSSCDAVVIASSQQVHAQQVIAAAQAGKHIFCEKPLALTPQELDAAQEAVTASGVTFMTAHQLRFHPVIKWVMANKARLGTVFHLDLEMPFLIHGHEGRCFEDYRSGGFFMELGCHLADLSRHIMGEVRHVHSFSSRLDPLRVTEDCTHCLLQFQSNAVASIVVSANHRGKRQGLLTGRLLGENGRIEFSIYPYSRANNGARLLLDDGKSVFVPHPVIEDMAPDFGPSLISTYKGFFDVYQQEAHAFVQAVRNHTTPPITFHDGRVAVEIILAAYSSQRLASEEPNFAQLPYIPGPGSHPLLVQGKSDSAAS